MHLEKQKPKFQIRLLEYGNDGKTIKAGSKNANIYSNADNLTLNQLWNKIAKAIESNK